MVISKQLKENLMIALVGVSAAFLLSNFAVGFETINGVSMMPTLHDGDTGACRRFGFSNVERYDIVALKTDELAHPLIKRIVGLPGETIEMKTNRLIVNGVFIEQSFLDTEGGNEEENSSFTEDFGPITLAEDEIFVLGDNRRDSVDSRVFGPFKQSDIICVGFFSL